MGSRDAAEALLVLGELSASCESYQRALAEHPSWRAGARMREQALWLLESIASGEDPASDQGAREALLEAFAGLPSIVIYGGSMYSDEDFPDGEPSLVIERLTDALQRLNPAVLYGSAKCGADLIVLEVAGEEVERQILLPGPEREFVAAAVAPGGDTWLQRFRIQSSGRRASYWRSAGTTPASTRSPRLCAGGRDRARAVACPQAGVGPEASGMGSGISSGWRRHRESSQTLS